MTDEKIIELAEKTMKEKYCAQNTVCVCEKPAIYDCDSECPIAYCDDCTTLCGDTIYEQGFLDGFRAGYKIGFDEGHDEGFTEARLGEDW